VPLVLVVPATLVDAPTSFDDLKQRNLRVAVADPNLTVLGQQTKALLTDLGGIGTNTQVDVATDAEAVLDHVLHGNADAGIIFGPDAVMHSESVRVVAKANERTYRPTEHSMAMERFSPDRALSYRFLDFIHTPEAQAAIRQLGYESPQ
jgi:molybdate transport system substrate-binding protein